MFRARTLFTLAALAATLAAQDFRPVVKAATLVFPGKTHFGVVCNYSRSRDAVAKLAFALPQGSTLTVVDTQEYAQVANAIGTILFRGVELLALLPDDPLVRDGSPLATGLVGKVRTSIPAFGTTPAALRNGCALALGEATGWELLLNPVLVDPNLKGVIGPIEITRAPRPAAR